MILHCMFVYIHYHVDYSLKVINTLFIGSQNKIITIRVSTSIIAWATVKIFITTLNLKAHQSTSANLPASNSLDLFDKFTAY